MNPSSMSVRRDQESQRVVPRSRDGTVVVGRQRHGVDRVRMAFERVDCLAALQVPESQRVVPRSRDGTVAVGRQHHGVDRGRIAFSGRIV
jgi:hypothetical protein